MANSDFKKNIPPKEEPVFPKWTRRMLGSKIFWIVIIAVVIYAIVSG